MYAKNLAAILVLMLVATSQGFAQVSSDPTRETLKHLKDNQVKLKSWKCSGIQTQWISPERKASIIDGFKKISARSKSGNDGKFTFTEYDFTYPKLFFSSMKGDSVLYVEKSLKNGIPKTVEKPTQNMLAKILNGGYGYAANSQKSYDVLSDNGKKLLREKNRRMFVPGASSGFFLNGVPIDAISAIEKYGFKYIGSCQDKYFGEEQIFAGRVPNSDARLDFRLAPNFGYRVVDSKEYDTNGSIRNDTSIVKMSLTDGQWLPDETEKRYYSNESGITKIEQVKTYRYLNKSMNDVSDEQIAVSLASGDHMKDLPTNLTYLIGANSEKILLDTPNSNTLSKLWLGWLYMASVTTLLVLTVGAYIRWKRNQLSKPA